MSKHNHPIIIKKRKHKGHEGGHGAWKIAYADFMTAMMAFFLVMWLIAMSTPKELVQIADYFKMPLKIALTGGPRSSDSESTIPGGGDDPTHEKGEVHKTLDAETIKRRMEAMRLNRLRESLDQMIESEPRLKALRPHLIINMVQEGLRIQIIDSQNRPMFKTGSSDVEPYMRDILRSIAPILNDMPNKISLAGHTDDIPYIGGERGYSNWELSTDRANASRRELVSGGLASGKVLRVVGLSDMMKLKNRGADDAINRRISLLVLNHETEEQIEKENAESYSEQVTEPEGVKQLVSPAQPAPPAAAAPVIKPVPSAPVAQSVPSVPVAPVAQSAPSAPVAPVAQSVPSVPDAAEAPSAQTVAPVTTAPNEQPVSPVNTKPSPDLQLSTPVDGHPADPVTTLPTAADGGSQVNHDSQQR